MRKGKTQYRNALIGITEEWLIILISILLLLVIAISAASARTLVAPNAVKSPSQQTMGLAADDDIPME